MKKKKNKKEIIIKENAWQDFIFEKKEIIIAFSVSVLLLLIYLSFPCKMFYFDGLMYSSIVEAKEPGWQTRLAWANHLSFNYYGHAFWRFLKYIGIERNGYSSLQIMNSFFSSATVFMFFLFVVRLVKKIWIAVLMSLLLGFSAAFWYRASDAQVYPPSVFHLTLSFLLAWSYVRYRTTLKLLLLSVSTGIAVLAHQGNVFFVPTAAAAILISNNIKRKKIKDFIIFSIIAGGIISLAYFYALTYQERILMDRNGNLTINKITLKTALNWGKGNAGSYSPDKYVNSYVNFPKLGELSFSKSIKQNLIDSNLRHFAAFIRAFNTCIWYGPATCVGYGFPGKQFWPTVSKILFVGIFLFMLIKTKVWFKYKEFLKLFAVWLITYILFVSWFAPGCEDYWYHFLIPLFSLGGCVIYEFLKDENVSLLLRKSVFGLFLCSIIIIPPVNFFDSIYPISIAENNVNYVKALFVKKYVKKGGVVIISGLSWNPGKVYIPSFADVGRISFDLIFVYNPKVQGLQILKNQVEMIASQGMNIYALDEIFYKTTEEGLKQWKVSMDEIKEIFKPYEFKTLGVYKDGTKIMQVFPKKGSAAYQRREGIKYYNVKDYRAASENFLKIPEKDKTSFDYKLIGNCYMLSNDKADAVSNWKKGYILNPSDGQLREIIQHYGQ